MIFTIDTLRTQLSELFYRYPELEISSQDNNKVLISGNIQVFVCNYSFTLNKTYGIDIIIPINSDELPYVIDKNNYISKKYRHRYNTGKLCLETDSAIRLRFFDGFSLVDWMREFVETYFFSYEYFMRYNCYPFGERAHGLEGIIQTYSDIFNTKDLYQTFCILAYISLKVYRGHDKCPCGSELHLRNCHGKTIISFYDHPTKRAIAQNDYKLIYNEVKKYGRNKN